MKELRKAAKTRDFNDDAAANRQKRKIHVLSVGPLDEGSLVHDVLLQVADFRLSIASDYRELWVVPWQEFIDVAILHSTLSEIALEEASRFIRQRWPHVRILVIRSGKGFLDDSLYDDRIAPPVALELLLATIERLVGDRRDRRLENAER